MTNKHIGSNFDDFLAEERIATPEHHWNYRVIEFTHECGETYRAIHEVFYANDVPKSYATDAAVVLWEIEEDDGSPLRQLDRMRDALSKPVLQSTDFDLCEKDAPDDK